jgi:hypothetical protein
MGGSGGFCKNEPDLVVPTLFGNIFWRHLHGVCMCKMGENTKSGSFLQKPPETLVYVIYIEH